MNLVYAIMHINAMLLIVFN